MTCLLAPRIHGGTSNLHSTHATKDHTDRLRRNNSKVWGSHRSTHSKNEKFNTGWSHRSNPYAKIRYQTVTQSRIWWKSRTNPESTGKRRVGPHVRRLRQILISQSAGEAERVRQDTVINDENSTKASLWNESETQMRTILTRRTRTEQNKDTETPTHEIKTRTRLKKLVWIRILLLVCEKLQYSGFHMRPKQRLNEW